MSRTMTEAEWKLDARRRLGIRDTDKAPSVDALIDQAYKEKPPFALDWLRDRLGLTR